MLTIFVVSDATGETAERMVRAALVQFGDAPVRLVRRRHVRDAKRARAVIREAAERKGLILHTLVSEDLRRLVFDEARRRGVDTMDMIGPLLDRLEARLRLAPKEQPGLLRQVKEAKTHEIEAVAFAFRHDDGQNLHELDRAEVVLVGVSRTMKTPTMLYLAYRGWFVANVPLVPDWEVPDGLRAVPPERVFCLTMSAERLKQLRRDRAQQERIPVLPYASAEQVRRELAFADQLSRKHRWRRIDVTGKSVEEVAREIITLLSE